MNIFDFIIQHIQSVFYEQQPTFCRRENSGCSKHNKTANKKGVSFQLKLLYYGAPSYV